MKIATFESRDGTQIACHVVGRGSPLVLVHGATADHSRWRPILPTLEQRFTIYALDRRGRGASGDAAEYGLEREVDDVATVIDGIGGPVDLLGHSYGALISLEVAARVTNLHRLALYEPPIPTGTPFVAPSLIERLEQIIAAGERESAVATFLTEAARIPENQLSTMKSLPAWNARVAAAHTIPRELRAALEYRFDPTRFSHVRVPILLILGGASAPLYRAAIDAIRAALPHANVAVLPDQQHVAMDTAPDMFLRELLAFLGN
jgi:pimeloyl-ACP methyl ester carboxylesterase